MKVPGLSYNSNINNELQESPQIIPNQKSSRQQPQPPQSTKKVWRLKKYTKSEDEFKSQQENYENLEFNNKKSSSTRRPKNKNNNGPQEFVFVDLSPTKKKDASISANSTPREEPKKQGRVSRLFRLNNSNDNSSSSSSSSTTTTTASSNLPTKEQSAPPMISSSQPIPSLQPHPISLQQQAIQVPPALKRSYTTANAARYNQSERSGSSASLVMAVSESGRAVLQPTASRTLSNSSSVSDLFSLSRMNSSSRHYSPIPSPKRMESPVHQHHLSELSDFDHDDFENEEDSNDSEHDYDYGIAGESDATKAFSKIIRKRSSASRKRANTTSSQNSNVSPSPVAPRLLTRNHSISSMNSAYKSRISPSRSNLMLRQTTLLQQQHNFNNQPLYSPQESNEFNFTSFFDDINNNNSPSRPSHVSGAGHKKTISISDNLVQLGPPLEVNSSDNDPESPYTTNTDVMLPFEFSDTLDHTQQQVSSGDFNGDDTLKEEDHQFFDFNAFVNYNEEPTQY